MYELVFSKKAIGQLNKLDKSIKERIWDKLQECKENPLRYFEHLTEIDSFRLRVGDFRVIADIDKKLMRINILKIGHRRNIYD